MGRPRQRTALGLVAAAALVAAGGLALEWRDANPVVAALQPVDADAPSSAGDAPRVPEPTLAEVQTRRAPTTSVEAAPGSARVPVVPEPEVRRPRGSFFALRGLGTLTGLLEIHGAARWAKAPEDSNLRLKIAPTKRIPEFEVSGVFRGQLPLGSMIALGERDGVRRWSFDAGQLPCGEYTLTLLPVGVATQVTLQRDRTSDVLVTLPALQRVELHVLEGGEPYPARGLRYQPWSSKPPAGYLSGRSAHDVAAEPGGAPGTFVLNAPAGERAVTVDLGELGSLSRTVQVSATGERATIEVTRRFAVELWIEDEHGRCLRPSWARSVRVSVEAGTAQLQSTRVLPTTGTGGARSARGESVDGLAALLRSTGQDEDEEVRAQPEPGPAVVWYFTGPGTAEVIATPPGDRGERTTLSAAIGPGEATRVTIRVPTPTPEPDAGAGERGLGLPRGGRVR